MPRYIHIITFISENNIFVTTEDIIDNQALKTGISRGVIRPYIYSILNRLKKRGQIISMQESTTAFKTWGLPGWCDANGNPLGSHKPKLALHSPKCGCYEVNPNNVLRRPFNQNEKKKRNT